MAENKTTKENTISKTDANQERQFPGAFNLFEPSWEALKLNFGTFLVLILSVIGVGIVAAIIAVLFAGAFKDNEIVMGILIALVAIAWLIFTMVVGPALTYTQIKSVQEKKVEADEAFQIGKKYIWRFLGLSLLVGLIVIVGLILLIIPGLFMLKRYLMAPYLLVDKDLSIGDAMQQSAELGKKYGGALWGIIGVEVLIALVSSIPFIGSLINLVLSVAYYCAPAVRYEQLKAAS